MIFVFHFLYFDVKFRVLNTNFLERVTVSFFTGYRDLIISGGLKFYFLFPLASNMNKNIILQNILESKELLFNAIMLRKSNEIIL